MENNNIQSEESTKQAKEGNIVLPLVILMFAFFLIALGAALYLFFQNRELTTENENYMTANENLTMRVNKLEGENSVEMDNDEEVEKKDDSDKTAEDCPEAEGEGCKGFITVDHSKGFSFTYPENMVPGSDIGIGQPEPTPIEDRHPIFFWDVQGEEYQQQLDIFKWKTAMRIDVYEKGSLGLEDYSKAYLADYASNENAFIKTLMEPKPTKVDGKDAYMFIINDSGISYVGPEGEGFGGELHSEGVVNNLIIDNGGNWIVINYYDSALYQSVVDSITFN